MLTFCYIIRNDVKNIIRNTQSLRENTLFKFCENENKNLMNNNFGRVLRINVHSINQFNKRLFYVTWNKI